MIDKCAIVPLSACIFALIVSPILIFITNPYPHTLQALMASQPENRIFWPAMAAISVVLAVRNRSRLSLPPHIICLLAYLAFAGASVLWAFRPEISSIRFIQQAMIVTSIVLPAMLASRTADMMRGLFLCFAFASMLNVFRVFGGDPIESAMVRRGSRQSVIRDIFRARIIWANVRRSLFCCLCTK